MGWGGCRDGGEINLWEPHKARAQAANKHHADLLKEPTLPAHFEVQKSLQQKKKSPKNCCPCTWAVSQGGHPSGIPHQSQDKLLHPRLWPNCHGLHIRKLK